MTNLVYVNNDTCPPCSQSIIVINGSSSKQIGSVNLGTYIDGIAVDPNTDTIFATSADSGSLYIVNGKTDSLLGTVTFPGSAMTVAVNPNTNTAYVPVCTQSFACTPAYVYVVNGGSRSIITRVPIDLPFAIAVNPATNMVYVTTSQNLLVSISGATDQITANTQLSAYSLECRGLAINSESNEIYVSCGARVDLPSFFIVDGSNGNILNSFVDNNSPMEVAYDSNNSLIYLADGSGQLLSLMSTEILLP